MKILNQTPGGYPTLESYQRRILPERYRHPRCAIASLRFPGLLPLLTATLCLSLPLTAGAQDDGSASPRDGKICELRGSVAGLAHYDPTRLVSGPLKNGKGSFLHEDLGAQTYAGMPVHGYRDTYTLNAGTLGNDVAMATVRKFRYSPELGFNLTSTLSAPQLGREMFTVSELETNEPDPKFFQPPVGYRVIDKRKPPIPAQ